ncbi:hypothetical protein B0G76_0790 [Paraburkholderia sp. BL23I1N1]|nr:hypothetical protein B0G76_0790 [Paraburkholderia sp. BL23I1N1]
MRLMVAQRNRAQGDHCGDAASERDIPAVRARLLKRSSLSSSRKRKTSVAHYDSMSLTLCLHRLDHCGHSFSNNVL